MWLLVPFLFKGFISWEALGVVIWTLTRYRSPMSMEKYGSRVFVVKRGTFLQALKTSRNTIVWIVYLGASDHMTCCYDLCTTYIPCARNIIVKITNDSLAPIARKGNI